MEKKSTLLLLCLLLAAETGTVRAQDVYHPITDGCAWSVSNEKYMTAGDTVLDGKTYLKLYRQVENQPFEFDLDNAEYFAAIRDDSAEKKVYAYLPAGSLIWDHNQGHHTIDNGMEVVLYDFSPQLGDYFSFYTICPSALQSAMEVYGHRIEVAYVLAGYENGHACDTFYVDSDSLITMSDGTMRKRILLETDRYIIEEVWIEGIGRLSGFDDFSLVEAEIPFKMMLCFSDSMGTTYQTGFDFDGTDDCFNYGHAGGDVPEWELLKVKIYPNPAADLLHIELRGAGITEVVLYDLQGRVVETMCTSSLQGTATDTLDVRSVPAGVYVLCVRDADGKKYHRKILKK